MKAKARESEKTGNENNENVECHGHGSHGHAQSRRGWMDYALLAGIGVLLAVSLAQSAQIGSLQAKLGASGTGAASLASTAYQGYESYDAMMASMHPDQYQAAQPSGSAQSRQVGGC